MSTIPSIDLIMNTTVGVEIEMTGITREAAARVAASVFSDNGRVWHKGGTYDKWTYTDGRGRDWDFVFDSSIETTGGSTTACEMNTPPITYAEDIEKLQNLIRALRHAGAKSGAQYDCGCHYASLRIIKKILKKPPFYQPVLSKSFHNNHSQYLLSQSRSDGLFRYSIGAVSGDFICSLAALSAS